MRLGFIEILNLLSFHLAQIKTVLLIRDLCYQRISRTLYLLEPEDGCSFSGYCWCGSFKKKCKRCHLRNTLEAKLKLPLRNAQVIFDLAGDDTNVIFHTENKSSNRSKRKCSIKLESGGDHRYQIENSCNGLLCLTDGLGYDNVVVCNPILGEFIYLPKSSHDGYYNSWFRVGLGFSPKNNQYKVFRVFSRLTTDPATEWLWRGTNTSEIHTLGTVSWRSVDIAALKLHFDRGPIYLNGALHWIDFGVIEGCLCVYDPYVHDHIEVWVMKEFGVRESWTKLISTSILNDEAPEYHYRPISLLNIGALLMFHRSQSDLMYYDDLRGLRYKHLEFIGNISEFEAITDIPSFNSLKDILMTANVEVLNINSSTSSGTFLLFTYFMWYWTSASW
ncbi:hypothetical protein TIFTF001_001681 [Ficus carica]|uniref:F-box associated beta-propeller type 1 domain-containing protein n=1 Tax=Ficus carica TaxID=3494 RepID=A0AA87ZPD1_FICCA|nr:hypothetical protein TIFTF001_001681 [Ficus carica]